MDTMSGGMCKCPHHKIGPVLIILFGITLLLGGFNLLTLQTVVLIFGGLITLGGLQKLAMSFGMCKCCSKP